MNLLNGLVPLILGALVAAGKPKALALLQDLHDSNPKDYKATIYGLDAGLSHLKEDVTDKSSNTIDDVLVADAEMIIHESAAKNGLTL